MTQKQKIFEAQFEVMLMDGEDQLYCENCKSLMDMKMHCTISELPDILTLHLQRFYMDYSYMMYKKKNCRVKIPLQLSAQEERDVLLDYELYAVVNHVGSLSGGHYYADIKSFKAQQWYRFNDSTVNSIHQKYGISDEAFMLFFRKSSKQHTNKVNVQQERPVPRSDESVGLETKRTSNPEDSICLPYQDTEHISTETDDNHESTVSSEKDMQALLNHSDSNIENQSNPPQTMTADVEMQSADADHDYQSTPNISSNAEDNIPSARSEIMSIIVFKRQQWRKHLTRHGEWSSSLKRIIIRLQQTYKDTDGASTQEAIQKAVVGIYVIRYEGADIEDSPADVGVVLEGEKVIQDLCSVPYATAMLLGLIYGLNLYPPELRYTFEVLQKLFLVLDGNKLSK